jgi:NTP pyrophosphatase (non-canonical NTP hydrolase)
MQLCSFQELSAETAVYPDKGNIHGLMYVALGLSGEAGEVANKVKKIKRDNGGVLTDHHITELSGELGDVLWYLAQIATELGLDLCDVATDNRIKLLSRQERGRIQGNGDTR